MMKADVTSSPQGIALHGALTSRALGPLWPRAMAAVAQAQGTDLTIDLTDVTSLDSSGAALILTMERHHQAAVELRGASPQAQGLLALLRDMLPTTPPAKAESSASGSFLQRYRTRLAFFGATLQAFWSLPRTMRLLRCSDFTDIAWQAGGQAITLVLSLGFLIGLILAFQSAVPMRQFGAELYVADLVTISLCRELGPLLVAVILAGRTGSSYAAELGTMRVNDEISALETMGINPMVSLVVPRIAAALLVMPVLTVVMDAAGLLGMAAVLMAFGYPLSAIQAHIMIPSAPSDFIQGMVKGLFFAAALALIGCRAGLTAKGGARAVGEAATAAVVGGIVATVVLDGIFAVVMYRLGL